MKIFCSLVLILLFAGCSQNTEIPDSQFIGKWMITDKFMYDGIEIEIKKENGSLKGYIVKLNDNKITNMALDIGDLFLSKVERRADSKFKFTERKIAASVFSSYGISSSTTHEAEFDCLDEIIIGKKGNKGKYIRIK